jgi:hypothetical protein
MGLTSTLARDWILDVLADDGETWTRVRGCSSLNAMFVTAEQDDSDIDSEGFASAIATGIAYSIEGSCKRKGDLVNGSVTDDPGQAILRRKGRRTGADNIVKARIYRRDSLPDAYQCDHTVKWTDTAAGDPNALQASTFTLTGRGKPEEIAKPTIATTVVKTITRGSATGGTFTLTVTTASGAQTTGALAYNISAAQLQSALEGLSNVGEGLVTVTGTAATTFEATFSVAVTNLTGAGTNLTPSGTITVA